MKQNYSGCLLSPSTIPPNSPNRRTQIEHSVSGRWARQGSEAVNSCSYSFDLWSIDRVEMESVKIRMQLSRVRHENNTAFKVHFRSTWSDRMAYSIIELARRSVDLVQRQICFWRQWILLPLDEAIASIAIHCHRIRIGRVGGLAETLLEPAIGLIGVAEDRRRWAAVTAEASVGVPQWRLSVTGFDWLIDWLTLYTNTRDVCKLARVSSMSILFYTEFPRVKKLGQDLTLRLRSLTNAGK